MEAEVDGTLSLKEQRDAIRFAERKDNLKLVSYEKRTAVANHATLEKVPPGQAIPELVLVEVTENTPIGSVVAAQLTQGKHLIFYGPLFVSGREAKVAGLR